MSVSSSRVDELLVAIDVEVHAPYVRALTRRRRIAACQTREERLERAASAGGSSTPHSSRAECIDSCGTPTSTVAMPRRVAVIGPIVEPHGMLFRDTKTCHGTPAVSHARRNSGGRRRRRGVSLVAVDLDRRTGVHHRTVVGIVSLDVVGMNGVGVVGGHAERAGQRSQEVVAGSAASGHVSFDHAFEQRAGGSGGRRRTDLLVVVEHDRRDRVVRFGGDQRRRPPPSTRPDCRAGRWRATTASPPSTAAGCTSYRHSSQNAGDSQPACSAIQSAKSPSSGARRHPTPVAGAAAGRA